MAEHLVVDSSNQLQVVQEPGVSGSRWLRMPAGLISYVFHPLFVPVYIILFLLYVHPTVFAGFSDWEKTKVLLPALLMYVFFPLVTVLLLKALGFIGSVFLRTQRDRVIPYIACNIWYFWVWYVWKNRPDAPPREIVILSLSIFIASICGLMLNIYLKISMHAIAMGVLTAFMAVLAFMQSASAGLYVSGAFLVAGLVCTSRLLVSNHTTREIYGGWLAGVVSILVALIFA